MKYIDIIIKLWPFIIQLVKAAEDWFANEPKSGAQKKATVMEGVKAVFLGLGESLTGGAAETWSKLEGIISSAVDLIVSFVFRK